MAVDAIVGLQRGDEGKGRFVDLVADEYDVIARGNGGANAGHTVVLDGMEPLALHQVPSGIAHPDKLNVIGNGVYVDPRKLVAEVDCLRSAGIEVSDKNLLISNIAHLVLPHHVALDVMRENSTKSQGSTKSGIAYVAADKDLREGMRVESLFSSSPGELRQLAYEKLSLAYKVREVVNWRRSRELQLRLGREARDWASAAEQLKPYVADTVNVMHERINAGHKVLAEGAQAFWLDINHGMYPAVTSSSTTVSGLFDGLGLSPKQLGKVTGVAKVVKSHVGSGPFVTEIHDEMLAETIRGSRGDADSEYGATTKRARRVGYPDIVELRNAININGVDEIALTKIDHAVRYGERVLAAVAYLYRDEIRKTAPSSADALEECQPIYHRLATWSGDICHLRDYSELPSAAVKFVDFVEDKLGVPVTKLGVGPERNQVIARR